mmetsp:Transcript_6868/g.17302  ORF Transcript_6868/g.17302 Transcript_6868/m.17302 type:complete len:127 (-) Transcript_6868:59-439(-)
MAVFLENLPSRGLLTDVVKEDAPMGEIPKYVAAHPTDPPSDQVITTDKTNILLRSLCKKTKKTNLSIEKGKSSESSSSKRPQNGDNTPSSKKQKTSATKKSSDSSSSSTSTSTSTSTSSQKGKKRK